MSDTIKLIDYYESLLCYLPQTHFFRRTFFKELGKEYRLLFIRYSIHSPEQIMEVATQDDPICLVVDPAGVGLESTRNRFSVLLAEQKNNMGVVVYTLDDLCRYKQNALAAVSKNGIEELSQVVRGEIERYHAAVSVTTQGAVW